MSYTYYQKMAVREIKMFRIRRKINDLLDKTQIRYIKLQQEHIKYLGVYDEAAETQKALNVITEQLTKLRNLTVIREKAGGHDYSRGVRSVYENGLGVLQMDQLNDSSLEEFGACPEKFKNTYYPPSKWLSDSKPYEVPRSNRFVRRKPRNG